MFCVRRPSSSTGRILVRGSITSHSQSTWVGAAEPGANFVQLQVREVQVAEAALMEEPSVLSRASKPGDDGGVTGAEDPLCGGWIQPFGKPQRGPWRPSGKEFSGDTRGCCAW